jgi:transcriptional repressor NrdR
MRCPHCTADSKVVDSRVVDDGIRRRRECLACASRFTTYERVEMASVFVVKRDGRREAFAREKLLAGVRRACEKRPLEAGVVETLAGAVEREVYARGVGEIASTAIGELVMERLKEIDGIAYVRFASVYRRFADLGSLRNALDELEIGRLRAAPVTRLRAVPGNGRAGGRPRIVPLPRSRRRGRTAQREASTVDGV